MNQNKESPTRAITLTEATIIQSEIWNLSLLLRGDILVRRVHWRSLAWTVGSPIGIAKVVPYFAPCCPPCSFRHTESSVEAIRRNGRILDVSPHFLQVISHTSSRTCLAHLKWSQVRICRCQARGQIIGINTHFLDRCYTSAKFSSHLPALDCTGLQWQQWSCMAACIIPFLQGVAGSRTDPAKSITWPRLSFSCLYV